MDKQALEIMTVAMPASYSIGQQYGTLDDEVIEFNTSGATAMYNPGSHMAGCTCPLCAFSFMDREKRDREKYRDAGDAPGQFVTGSYPLIGHHSLQERVDASDTDRLHLNYDITNIKRGVSRDILNKDDHFKSL